jgi:hypothetical protein
MAHSPEHPKAPPALQLYTLRYNKQTVQTVTFFAPGLDEAIALGKKYCDTFRLRFIHVGPYAVDLEEIIANKEKHG